MPVDRDPISAARGAVAPVARAAAAEVRADRRAAALALDLFQPDEARLDERTRAGARALLGGWVERLERAIRVEAVRRLIHWGEDSAAERLALSAPVLARLGRAGVLADPDLAADLVGQAELAQLAQDLPATATGPDRPSLLVRLAECPEPAVAQAAATLLEAITMTRDGGTCPEETAARLGWSIAAALDPGEPCLASALAQAAAEVIARPAAPDEARAATALAAAIAARPDELPDLLVECLGDRQPALFAALLAEALGLPFDAARSVLVDRDGARLALCLRAAGLERATIARIGVALADAEVRRDLERFADQLDDVAALDPATAAAALAPLALPLAFRRARRELGA